MTIKILHLINHLGAGGAQSCLQDITAHESPDFKHYIYALRAGDRSLGFDVGIFNTQYVNYDIRKFFYLIKLCKRLQIDIVHSHLHKSCMFAVMLKLFYPCKVIIHEHGPIDRAGLGFSIYRLFMKLFAKSADCIIAVSKQIRQKIKSVTKIDESKITLLYNCVDTEAFKSDEKIKHSSKAKYDICDDFVIGYIGRLNFIKGVDLLIKAFDFVDRSDTQNLKLLIVGSGRDEKKLKALAAQSKFKGDIIFTGFCGQREKIIQAFDIAAVPSRQEPFGIAVIELMAAGVPLACSGVGGIGEIIEGFDCAQVFENNPQSIARSLSSMINDAQKRQSLRENSLKRAADFQIAAYIEKLNKIYTQLYSCEHQQLMGE